MFVKFLGFALFSIMATCGFWLLISLLNFVPYWVWNQSRESLGKKNKDLVAEPIQKPLKVLYKKD